MYYTQHAQMVRTAVYQSGKEDTTCRQDHMGDTLGCRVSQQGLWKAGFVVARGWGDLWDNRIVLLSNFAGY